MIRPGVLRFMGSQRVGHDWVTDLIWSESPSKILQFYEWTFFEVFSYSWFYLISWTPSKEVRSLVFYTWGAGPQRGRLVCPKSPWICVRACVKLWLSFSGPLSLLLGCLPQCLQCPQRLWCQEMLWMPFSWWAHWPGGKETLAGTSHPKTASLVESRWKNSPGQSRGAADCKSSFSA